MARISFNHPYVNFTQGSVDKGTGVATSVPDYKPGWEVKADSGIYRYLQATSATSTGHLCKVILSGVATSNYNATRINTTDSGIVPTDCGVAVTDGGLAANQWGWFWLGEGEEYVRLASTANSYQTSVIGGLAYLGTWTTAGEVSALGSGDMIDGLVAIDSNTSSGLRLCRSARLLKTNPAYGNTSG